MHDYQPSITPEVYREQESHVAPWPIGQGQEISPTRTVNVMPSMQPWARKNGLKFR